MSDEAVLVLFSMALTDTETVTAENAPQLSIQKAMSPTVVSENGQLTYTLTIQNLGNTPITVDDDVTVADTFDPILNPIAVTFNGTAWTEGTNYTYDTTTGRFVTSAGQITVPAATFTQHRPAVLYREKLRGEKRNE